MANVTSVYFSDRLWYNDSFQQAKKERKLSSIINILLDHYFNVENDKNNVQTRLIDLDQELLKIDAERTRLIKKKDDLKKEIEKRKKRYTVI